MFHGKKIVVVMPAYNAAKTIEQTYREIPLDLVDQASIAQFADEFAARFTRLDILLNNAAVVNLPTLQHTREGYEMHMATNHYGHFALT